jgi:hypothetical protein
MNCDFVFGVFIIYLKVRILVKWNNHASDVLMNGSVKYVEN